MQGTIAILVTLSGLGVGFGSDPTPSGVYLRYGSSYRYFTAAQMAYIESQPMRYCIRGNVLTEMNPHAVRGEDAVKIAAHDGRNIVASQREAIKVGSDHLKAQVEFWKYSRPNVVISGGTYFSQGFQYGHTDSYNMSAPPPSSSGK